jgi:uridylate kinase
MKLVIKIGGSTIYDGYKLKIELIRKWIALIEDLRRQEHQVGVVIGGGKPARQFAKAAKQLGATNSYQDFIGIEAARQNARLFISGLHDAYPNPPRSYQQLIEITASNDLVIAGGFQPGQSTNAVAALFAEHIGADYLFNISDISKVYDKDPDKYDDAIPFDELSYSEFTNLVHQNEQLPGTYDLFDHIGVDVMRRSRIPLVFINGEHPEHIMDILNGKSRGTIIQ